MVGAYPTEGWGGWLHMFKVPTRRDYLHLCVGLAESDRSLHIPRQDPVSAVGQPRAPFPRLPFDPLEFAQGLQDQVYPANLVSGRSSTVLVEYLSSL
jgi:hypothetical protein